MGKDKKMSVSEFIDHVLKQVPEDYAGQLDLSLDDEGWVDDCRSHTLKLSINPEARTADRRPE